MPPLPFGAKPVAMPPLPFKKPEMPAIPFKKPEKKVEKLVEEGPPPGYEPNGDWLKVEKFKTRWN